MNNIHKTIKTCKIIHTIALTVCTLFCIAIVALCGDPVPGSEGLSIGQLILGEAICFAGAIASGFFAARIGDYIKYLRYKKR